LINFILYYNLPMISSCHWPRARAKPSYVFCARSGLSISSIPVELQRCVL